MTFKELLEGLKELTEEDLNKTATVMIEDEFYAVEELEIYSETDILDEGQPYIAVGYYEES